MKEATILVVDDEPSISEVVSIYLRRAGYHVIVAQGERSRSRDTAGSGLGLAIAKGIVGAHGGRVGVESIPGQSTRFFFTLPMR